MSAKQEGRSLPRLQQRYESELRANLREQFGYKNEMQVPHLEKIVLNMGVGEAAGDQKKLDAAVAEMALIAGQKPVKTVAKKLLRASRSVKVCRLAVRSLCAVHGCMNSLIVW